MLRGIDVSNHKGGIVPHELDIDFCITKATESINFVDAYCDVVVQDCIANDILWGFYHYNSLYSPEDEAQFFYDNCVNYFEHGIPILDYEVHTYNDAEWVERFVQKLHDLSGIWCMIYTAASWVPLFRDSWVPEKCGLWVAGYPYTMTDWTDEEMPYNIYPWEFAAIWQFTSSLILPGYHAQLDGNIAYMDETAWMKYAQSTDNPHNVEKPKPEKSIDDLVYETILGEYGNGEDRKKMLGSNYEKVQNRINELYRIANEVISGRWGNGWNREQALEGAGYPYQLVQKIVNDIMN